MSSETWQRLCREAHEAGLLTERRVWGDEVIWLGWHAELSFEVLTGQIDIVEDLQGRIVVTTLPSGDASTIVEILEYVHLWRVTAAELKASEPEDPLPWAVWNDAGDIIGAGSTALQAIERAVHTVEAWRHP